MPCPTMKRAELKLPTMKCPVRPAPFAPLLAGLPPLTGNPTDVQAAGDIRISKLIEADDLLSAMRGNEAMTEEHALAAIPPPHVTHAQVQQTQAALNRLRHQADAAWWIAHQSHSAQALLDAFMSNPL